jgi:cytochrome c oxidase subunit 3
MNGWGMERFVTPPTDDRQLTETDELPATGRGAVAVSAPVPAERDLRFWGMVWFIATEATFFVSLIASYIYLRAIAPTWPPPGVPHRDLVFPAINTVILLASGIPAYYAERAISRGNQRGLATGLLLAAILGTVFLLGQVYEYLNAGMSLTTNVFAAAFFVLTGFHGAHVVVGIGLLLVILVRARRGLYSARDNFAVQFASTYWHFVDVVWIFVFLLLYIMQ